MSNGAPILQTAGLGRRYASRWALADLSLRLPQASALLVTGRNGSGKSTLLRVLATAIRPSRGTARVLGFDVVRQRNEVRRRVAYLSHQLHVYEALTVAENLRIAARFLNLDGHGRPLEELLAEVGLEGRDDDPVSTLSAGLRRRLALARVLLQEPEVLLLDEPYAQLDPVGFQVVDSVVRGARARGATVVMVTHVLEGARDLCDQAIRLDNGRLVWAGPARDVEPPGPPLSPEIRDSREMGA
jgi:heme exporter protein A